MKSKFGLHIRLHESLFDALDKIERLEQRFFQTVLMLQTRKFLNMTDEDIAKFVKLRRKLCDQVFAHGAYWSNITDTSSRGFYSLTKEVELAEKLEFTHIVIHPGSFAKDLSIDQRVDYIMQGVQALLAASSHIIILLENSPHKDKAFSCNFEEFGLLFSRLGKHPRIKMCIDTAHAYVAGYDITTPKKVDDFVKNVVAMIGFENIGLLHANDTKKKCGSYLDEHAVPGYGNIGMEALYHFVHHPLLHDIPVILEMPALDESLESDILQQFIAMETLKS